MAVRCRLVAEGEGRHPGDMWWAENGHRHDEAGNLRCYAGWTNCPGRHLCVILPDRHVWDIDSRASNCTAREDGTHRCWVRHGEPPHVHADKAGHTCAAGGGSIQSPSGWHGYLDAGWLTTQRGVFTPDETPKREEAPQMADYPAPTEAVTGPSVPPDPPAAPAGPPPVPHPEAQTEGEHWANLQHALRVRFPAIHGYAHLWTELADHLHAWREALMHGGDLELDKSEAAAASETPAARQEPAQ